VTNGSPSQAIGKYTIFVTTNPNTPMNAIEISEARGILINSNQVLNFNLFTRRIL